jgi:hypothetical protein
LLNDRRSRCNTGQQDPAQMLFVQNDKTVDTFTPDRSDEPLGKAALQGVAGAICYSAYAYLALEFILAWVAQLALELENRFPCAACPLFQVPRQLQTMPSTRCS